MIGLSQERLKELLEYDPITGLFTWLIASNGRIRIGEIAGTEDSKGYIVISIGGQRFKAHQLAWFYIYGEWRMIDHKEWPRSNNAIDNLRPATYSQNNHRKYTHNPHGYIGVRFRAGFYEAHIRIDGVVTRIGKFATAAEAGKAYARKAIEVFGDYAEKEVEQLD